MSNKLWPKKKISWLFDVIGSGTTPSASNEVYYNSPDIAWLNTGDLTDGYVEKTSKYVSQQALDEFSALTVFPKESLVMAMYGATIGKLGITKYETTTNQACCVLAKPKGIVTKFSFYWLMAHRLEIINLSQGGGQPNISQGIIRDIRISVPPIELQNKIVALIDKKFEETNQLINRKEKMITLLEQQRQSIITEAVTKGLNPNVKMKDSGVEWIGEIPEHWNKTKFKYITNKIIDGTHSTPNYIEEGVPFLRVTDITKSKGKEIDLENVKYISEEEHRELVRRCKPEKGDLLVSKNGTIGIPKVVTWDWDFSIFVSLCLIKLKNDKINPFFSSYFFESELVEEQIAFGTKKSTIMNLHLEKVKEFFVLLPPLEEQLNIVEYLNKKTRKYSNLIDIQSNQIDKLKEYRQSLIYEAVTGKIDVRDMELD